MALSSDLMSFLIINPTQKSGVNCFICARNLVYAGTRSATSICSFRKITFNTTP